MEIENETFNTLKNQGYNFEHNYGHGEQHLSVVFAMLMMLAFLVDQAQQLCCALFQAVWAKLGSKRMSGSGCERCFTTMPLRPCASCSKRSYMALRSLAPSCYWIPRNLSPLLLRLRALKPEVCSSRGTTMPSGRELSVFDKTACHVAS